MDSMRNIPVIVFEKVSVFACFLCPKKDSMRGERHSKGIW